MPDDLNNVGNIPAGPETPPSGIDIAKKAATTATLAVTEGTSSQSTKDAVNSLSQGLTALAEELVAKTLGPVAAVAGDLLIPEFVPALVNSIAGIFDHIGMAIPAEFAEIQKWIASKI